MGRLSSLVLVVAILFAQAALLEHEYDFAAHEGGDTCVKCLHATPLTHGMVGAVPLVLPLPDLNTKFQPLPLQIIAITIRNYRARAPPFILSA